MVAKYTVNGDSIVLEKPRLWTEKRLASLGLVGTYSVSSDGKRVAAVVSAGTPEAQTTQNHVTFLLNFFDEIRRRLAAESRTP
jgi:serine/threonine-protein kinase